MRATWRDLTGIGPWAWSSAHRAARASSDPPRWLDHGQSDPRPREQRGALSRVELNELTYPSSKRQAGKTTCSFMSYIKLLFHT